MGESTIYDHLGLDPRDQRELNHSHSHTDWVGHGNPPGTHVTSFYTDLNSQLQLVAEFFAEGLDRGERCVYVGQAEDVQALKRSFETCGVDVASATDSEDLILREVTDVYHRQGELDLDATLEWLQEEIDAVAAGAEYHGLRLVGEDSCVLDDLVSRDQWMEYEARVNNLDATIDYIFMCLYDIRRFPDEIIFDLVRTHPFVLYEGQPFRNPLFEPPDEFLGTDNGSIDSDRLMQALVGQSRSKRALAQRERELDRTVEFLSHTERIADVGGWELDPEGMDLYWSDHLYEILDVPDDFEPTVERVLDATHRADRQQLQTAFDSALENGELIDVEVRVFTLDGDIKWLHILGVPDLDNGEVVRVRGAAQDITRRKEREEALDQTRQRMELALDATDATVWEWDFETDTVRTHPDPHGLFHTSIRTGGEFIEAIHPDDREEVQASLDEAIETDEPYHVEYRYRRNDDVRWAEDFGKIFEGGEGGGPRMLGVAYDITDRMERQRALAESEQRYRTLVDHFPNGAVFLYDSNFQYVAAGGEAIDDLGLGDPVGDSIFERYPPDLVDEIEPHVHAALDGEEREFEVEFMDRYFLARTLPIRDGDGEPHSGMLVVLDITEERESKRRLEESHERLEEFASAVSHDLREPLGTVASYLQLLERRYEDDLDEDAEEFIDFAVGGAERMREMIDGLVKTYARVEAEGKSLEPLDLDTVLDDVRQDLSRKIEASDADITTDPLPTVKCDHGQLRQVLMNLIDNAIKYSGGDPPRVHVSADCGDEMCEISVSDEGIGMSPEATEQVFDVFQRAHPEDEYPGTGIGLALCERIVERHGGEIWVESEPGEGSTFTFTVPAAQT